MANRYDTNLILDRIADALDDDQNSALIDALTTIANAISQSGGGDIPSGGTMGQLLGKRSNQDFDVMWYDNLGDDALSNQASEYNPQSNYVVGDYCLHTNYLYVCISPTTGNWDSTCWNRVQFGEQISSLNSKLPYVIYKTITDESVNTSWGTLYLSSPIAVDYSSLGLQSVPNKIQVTYVATSSTGAFPTVTNVTKTGCRVQLIRATTGDTSGKICVEIYP